ncbi:MAG: hypothetical protein O2931_01290 [Planctomycetota bacterium]|nr:hypothetical protein [Planctomycetota bacterium]MDA1177407.1 hypothetical protein [Planctomycetota bacterium]
MNVSSATIADRKDQPESDSQPVPGWLASGVLHLVLMSFFVAPPVSIYAPPAGRVPLVLEANFPHASVDESSVAVIAPAGELSDHSESVDSSEPGTVAAATANEHFEVAEVAPSQPIVEERAMAIRHVPRRALKTSQAPKHWPSPDERKETDQIVDRFIQYDIGQLSPADGRKALTEFQSLGCESVPSLVSGLNRSARIQYSCPVGVLSAKLVQLLLQGKDSSLTAYVVRNLGQGVPESAPHHQRLIQLRKFIAQQDDKSLQSVRDDLKSRQLPVSREMLQLVEEMTLVPPDQLESEIRYGDPVSQTAAMLGLLRRADELPPTVRIKLARQLVGMLKQENPVTGTLSHETLVRLAHGLDFGKRPQDSPSWIEYWRGMEANLEGILPEQESQNSRGITSEVVGPAS